MAYKGKTQIEVKVLRSQSGEVIFLESGPDFVEALASYRIVSLCLWKAPDNRYEMNAYFIRGEIC